MTTLTNILDSFIQVANDLKHLNNKIGIPTLQGTGRPDIPATLSAENQTATDAAPNATKFISTDGAGVNAYEWQKVDGNWQPTAADTGWLDMSNNDGTTWGNTPQVAIRRINNTVHIQLDKWRGHRIHLPKGFTYGNGFIQQLAGTGGSDADGKPVTGLIEVSSTGDLYQWGSNQSKPWAADSTVTNHFWCPTTGKHQTQFIWKINNLGAKTYLTFATPEPFPLSLAIDKCPLTRPSTIVSAAEIACNGTGYGQWDNPANFTDPEPTTPVTATATLDITTTFSRPTLECDIELRAGANADKLNGVSLLYTLDGTTWTDSGIDCSGHTDNEPKAKEYTIPIANIKGIRLSKTGGVELKAFLLGFGEY